MTKSNGILGVLLFILLVFLQTCIFDKIHLFGVATPVFYIYFILKLPANTNRNWVVLLSFVMGFFIDLFGGTLGLNMLAATIAGFLRHYLLRLFSPRDIPENSLPSISVFGKALFFRYAGSLVLIHLIILFVVESLSLFDALTLVLRITGSFLLTMLLVWVVDGIHFNFLKK